MICGTCGFIAALDEAHDHERATPGHPRDPDHAPERPAHPVARDERGSGLDAQPAAAPLAGVDHAVLERNARLAAQNRAWLAARRVLMLDFIGSPGAGKTALLETLLPQLAGFDRAVLDGHPVTSRDAERVGRRGCRVKQVNTGAGCHLDAAMVAAGLEALSPAPGGVVLIDNVGSLVCPALFDLGERAKIVLLSVTEGEDKPLRYPHVFRAASLCVLTKMDLLPHLDFAVGRCLDHLRAVNPKLTCLRVSVRRPATVELVGQWVRGLMRQPAPHAALA